MADDDIDVEDDEIIACWCGATGTYDELFDDDCLDGGCGGTGYVDCHCGGDQCVCHHRGQEVEYPGCDECDCGDEDGCDDGWDERDCDWEEQDDG